MEVQDKIQKNEESTLILIPARYQSKRFPGKPLALINGRTLIERVCENAKDTSYPYFVITDSPEIEKHLKDLDHPVIRVDDNVTSGSDRVAIAWQKIARSPIDYKIESHKIQSILLLQGDEPLLSAETIIGLAKFHQSNNFDLTTLIKKREGEKKLFHSPHIVKAVWEEKTKKCHYFSRSPVPYTPDLQESFEKSSKNVPCWFHHIGIYCYTPHALEQVTKAESSELEKREHLEQLRALGLGKTIGAICTQEELMGIDIPSDIKEVEILLNKKHERQKVNKTSTRPKGAEQCSRK